MLIKGLQKHTVLDYPGKIACTIFLFGCNFRCGYCHNPELVKTELAKTIKTYSQQEILNFLASKRDFLDGVCITGGEPTLNQDLPKFIEKINQLGYKIKLDTNGTNPKMLEKLLKQKLVDYVAMDIKAPLEKEAYEKATNVKINIKDIEESINLIKKFPEYEFRMTVTPTVTTKQDIIKIAKYLKQHEANNSFYLQEFRNKICLDPKFEKLEPYGKEKMNEFHEAIKPYLKTCEIRNESY